MILTGDGGDQVVQRFDGSQGQAMQSTILSSDGNEVRNNMAISIGVDAGALVDQVRSTAGLDSFFGLNR